MQATGYVAHAHQSTKKTLMLCLQTIYATQILFFKK